MPLAVAENGSICTYIHRSDTDNGTNINLLNYKVMKKIIYDYLKKNVTCDNWGVVCLDDFCKEYGFTLDSVCNTLEEMRDKVLCAYFMENFGGCGCQMLDYDLI